MVDVAVVLVAKNDENVREPSKYPFPATESFAKGEVVPMPTLPPSVASQVSDVEVNRVEEAFVKIEFIAVRLDVYRFVEVALVVVPFVKS